MNDHAPERSILQTVSRGRRRRLVLTMYLSLAAVVLVFGFAPSDWWFVLSLGALFVAFSLYAKLLLPIMRELTAKKDPELDERQLAVRNRAYYYAYGILAGVFGLSVLYAMVATLPGSAGGADLPMPSTLNAFTLLVLLISHLVISLPASVVAWTEPDPLFDED